MKRQLLVSAFLFLAGFFLIAPSPSLAQKADIILAGYKMKPRVATSGSGLLSVALHGDTLEVSGNFSDLTHPYSGAYIMVSLKGQAGNQLYTLTTQLNEEKTGGTLKAEDNKIVLSPAAKQLLKKGELYITISSFEHQRGELRGNIPPME